MTETAALLAPTPAEAHLPTDGRVRAVVDAVLPEVDGGRHPVKRVAGDRFVVDAHCVTDGHDVLRVRLQWRRDDADGGAGAGAVDAAPHELPMTAMGNDVWRAAFLLPAPGRYAYRVVAWVDGFASWRTELLRRVDADDIRIAARVGAELVGEAAQRAEGSDRLLLADWSATLRRLAEDAQVDATQLKAAALDEPLAAVAERHPDRRFEATYRQELSLVVDRERARCGAWYELFPRSTSPEPGRHGTFRDVIGRLPAIAQMGFDVLYMPPIHPIGRIQRKGKNNALVTEPGDVGSPWAIGAAEGGHKSILPELGTADDFRALVAAAAQHGIELALDIAFQCAPDHPYVKEHPGWFRWRPDGSVQYAENPPKKYQDIYPFNFECDDWQALWLELKSVFTHWIDQGVTIFRVDNPHTKAFPFWEWCIAEVKRVSPGAIFLAEAFTRPKVMHGLAKAGFSQSYTYFTWRNTKQELTAYFTELSQGPGREYFRPNAWPNTPDILPEPLQSGQRAVFALRLVLAATLAANYGIYGPSYELLDHAPRGPSSEEYLDSEKYQLRQWDLARADSLAPFIARINRIRRDNVALQSDHSLRFLNTDNDQLLAYVKRTGDAPAGPSDALGAALPPGVDRAPDNLVLCVVNLDPYNVQSGWVELDEAVLGIDTAMSFQMHDVLGDQRFLWQGRRQFVKLDPQHSPAHVFVLRRRLRSERDFDYFL